ncbi:DUF4157 domain-containing protein (plasmid) [Acaryochloris sp. CCMEE 5410]|nr:DUF4157 domain-containing protein [Acaryochloris sp. CCMEE 5410]
MCTSVPRPSEVQSSVQPPQIQARSNEEGLAEHAERLKKFQRLGSSMIQMGPPRLDNDQTNSLQPKPWIQRKLTLGEPGDKYELEADRVASHAVQQINAPASKQSNLEHSVHHLESAINSARGSGHPLDAKLQQSMGQAMGADFSGVRVHTDAQSDQLNQSIQARAFTTGQDVFFREGAYQPGNRGGQELIAHELTHVVQQDENSLSSISESSHSKQVKPSKTNRGQQISLSVNHVSPKHINIQRVATSIEWSDAKEVQTLEVEGRPPGTQGAHTTAFVVFVQGLRNRLFKKNFSDVLKELKTMTAEIKNLPGFSQGTKYMQNFVKDAVDNLINNIDTAILNIGTISEIKYTQIIQEFCNQYLRARNQVHFTADKDVKGSSPLGEAASNKVLVEYVAGYIEDPTEEDASAKAIAKQSFKLFDWKVTKKLKPDIVAQHLISIDQAFPGIIPLRKKIVAKFLLLVSKKYRRESGSFDRKVKDILTGQPLPWIV